MRAVAVTLEAEALVREIMMIQEGATRGARTSDLLRPSVTIERIELFAHALYPERIIFGTASINGQALPLPQGLLERLSRPQRGLDNKTRPLEKHPALTAATSVPR